MKLIFLSLSKTKIGLFIYILSLTVLPALAQENKQTTICGKFDMDIDGKILIAVHKFYFSARGYLDTRVDTIDIINREFKYTTNEILDSTGYISIFCFPANDLKTKLTNLNKVLVKRGSNIIINITEQGVNFSGIGSELLKIQYEVNLVPKSFYDQNATEASSLEKTMDENEFSDFLREKHRDYYIEKKRIIESYRENLDNKTIDKLLAYYDAEKASRYGYFNFAYNSYSDVKKKHMLEYYRNTIYNRSAVKNYSDDLVDVPQYVYVEFLNLRDKLKYESGDYQSRPPTITPLLFNEIKKNYSGKFKERLLMEFIVDLTMSKDPKFYDYCVEVSNLVSNKEYKVILHKYLVAKDGTPAFAFSLPDNNGKLVDLRDFKDKLIVIDFWFLYCSSCIELEGYMKNVRKVLEQRTDIVFMSVNVDVKKEAWLEGLKSGKYTDSNGINLSTFGLGTKHPVFTYYGYSGCPQLLIIDKAQNIVSSQPIRPNSDSEALSFGKYLENLASQIN